DRTVRYNWRNFKFKFKLKVNKNDSLPSSYSIADLNPNSTLGFVELIVEDWLDLDPIINFKCTLYGQVFIQENGFAAILLKIRSLS
ncbi:MAG: hypothetical protein KA770_09240, partial [Shewanella sp.]|nr:hypothetical protein [Shewanella sp.]